MHNQQAAFKVVDMSVEEGFQRHNIKQAFKSFVNNPDSKPYTDPKYGTRYQGTCRFLHFVVYAILRGRDPLKCSHKADSDKMLSALHSVYNPDRYRPDPAWRFGDSDVKHILENVFKDVVTPEYWVAAVEHAKQKTLK